MCLLSVLIRNLPTYTIFKARASIGLLSLTHRHVMNDILLVAFPDRKLWYLRLVPGELVNAYVHVSIKNILSNPQKIIH